MLKWAQWFTTDFTQTSSWLVGGAHAYTMPLYEHLKTQYPKHIFHHIHVKSLKDIEHHDIHLVHRTLFDEPSIYVFYLSIGALKNKDIKDKLIQWAESRHGTLLITPYLNLTEQKHKVISQVLHKIPVQVICYSLNEGACVAWLIAYARSHQLDLDTDIARYAVRVTRAQPWRLCQMVMQLCDVQKPIDQALCRDILGAGKDELSHLLNAIGQGRLRSVVLCMKRLEDQHTPVILVYHVLLKWMMHMRTLLEGSGSFHEKAKALKLWRQEIPVYQSSMDWCENDTLLRAYTETLALEMMIKGVIPGAPWDALRLCLYRLMGSCDDYGA